LGALSERGRNHLPFCRHLGAEGGARGRSWMKWGGRIGATPEAPSGSRAHDTKKGDRAQTNAKGKDVPAARIRPGKRIAFKPKPPRQKSGERGKGADDGKR